MFPNCENRSGGKKKDKLRFVVMFISVNVKLNVHMLKPSCHVGMLILLINQGAVACESL